MGQHSTAARGGETWRGERRRARPHARPGGTRDARHRNGALACVACAALLWAAVVPVALGAAVAHAAGTGAQIHWDSSMIYAGQNNGLPEGPVGEQAKVHGAGFTDPDGTQLTLQLVQGDILNPTPPATTADVCALTPTKVALPGSVTVQRGTFDYSFQWPTGASGGPWSICAYAGGLPADGGTSDDGPFTVLASDPPSISISNSSVQAGGALTVSGQNFLPAQNNIQVVVGPCHNCGTPATVTQTVSSSGAQGTFTATLTLPSGTAAGHYVVNAFNSTDTLDLGLQHPNGIKAFNVTAVPTPSPSPTATALPSPTASAPANPTVTATTTTGQTSTSGQNSGLIIALIVALGAVLLGLAALVMLASRRPPTPPGAGGGYQQPLYTPPEDYDPSRPTVFPGQGGGAREVGPDDPTDPGLTAPRR